MALSKSNSANGNVTDIAEARRNRGQAQKDASSQSNAPPGDTALSDDSDVAFEDDAVSYTHLTLPTIYSV